MGFLFITSCLCLCLAWLNYVHGSTNTVFEPCADTLVQRNDGFTLGFAFASNDSFFFNKTTRLSPCDQRLSLHTNNIAQLALFRPTVDQFSLLTINITADSIQGGYMVAFAGLHYAAISFPQFVCDQTVIITSFTLILEFDKGRLLNLFWKNYGCKPCREDTSAVCYNGEACAMNIKDCKSHGGNTDCNVGIQLAFSGTDKRYSVLNSWYGVQKMDQYSLFGL